MVERHELMAAVEAALQDTGLYVVEVTFEPDGVVDVALDCDEGSIGIDDCVRISQAVHDTLGEALDDCDLTVGSYGISSPLLLPRQYVKNIGEPVEVLTRDGRKLKGTLTAADDNGFTLTTTVKERVDGKKRPQMVDRDEALAYDAVKRVQCIITI